jgi:hypothetical protein
MQAKPEDMIAHGIGFEHCARPHCQTMADFHVREFVDAGTERLVEYIGLAKGRAIVKPHAGLDETGGAFRGNRLRQRISEGHAHAFYPV